MIILGINFGHSASAVLLKDGRITDAVEEEKLIRIKGSATFPQMSVKYLLNKNSILPGDIGKVAISCKDIAEWSYFYRNLNKYFNKTGLLHKMAGLFFDGIRQCFPFIETRPVLIRVFYKYMASLGFDVNRIELVEHHLAHAASAYYPSKWCETAILTSDGKGDGLSGTFSIGINGKIRCVDEISDLNSIGQFYSTVTKYLGFQWNRHEGKITGLAAYGDDSKTYGLMNSVFTFDKGRLKNSFQEIPALRKNPLKYYSKVKKNIISGNYLRYLHGTLRNFAISYQLYYNFLDDNLRSFEAKDIAAGIQRLLEESILEYLRNNLKKHRFSNICLAGGVFANVKLNQKIMELPGIKNVYVHPAMDDAGTALGAAIHVNMKFNNDENWTGFETVYTGCEYAENEIINALEKYNLPIRRLECYEDALGRWIHEGKIIGRFNGATEWGPRALGNRSILARPIEKVINDTLNERLKRTEFMPFAPSVLAEDASNILRGYSIDHIASRYMTMTYHVNPSMINLIPAVVHVDGTARPQVVFEEDNPSYYKIIKAYKRYSGIGCLVNTSFNMHEEPIVNSPEDAIRAFLTGAVDILSMGEFVVDASDIK
jgi:carbamoyltransferase